MSRCGAFHTEVTWLRALEQLIVKAAKLPNFACAVMPCNKETMLGHQKPCENETITYKPICGVTRCSHRQIQVQQRRYLAEQSLDIRDRFRE
jgi:hypothetical protein